ncbi:GWxTD domain-containing protein [Hymenobacter sediminicola]|uniref:GWxTD domain-containing protein n=1 Tax=Hymenobacter sediminicola TaxID=2761579 RepID=A0A7G7W9K7_9BACT|nr:GWxTD domain-containing protein [Hymenobacter sediminicola]QNH63050.1 GWxTD domain-containing protein [Hymenobacter sediminicola]
MNHPVRLLLFCGFLLTLLPAASAQRRDFAGQYHSDQKILVDSRREGDSLRIYLRFPNGSVLQQKQPLRVLAWPAYDAKRPVWADTVSHLARRTRLEGSAARVEFCLPIARLQSGTILSMACGPASVAASGEAAWLPLTAARLARPYILADSLGVPLLRRTVRAGEAFYVDRYGPEQPVSVKQYTTPFVAALPPHADPSRQAAGPATLAVRDSLFARAGVPLALPEPGLYTLRLMGEPSLLGLLVTGAEYPDLTTADELIQPLIYLTTSTERKNLYDAPNPKRAVDEFWLKAAAGQQTLARQAIRLYYSRAATANQLFAAHKAGWMTDRGMLYMVLGAPDAVYRTAQEERWVYHARDNGSSATYMFRPKPSTFAPEHYELVRRPENERLWYAAVEQWRKAMTAPGR